MQPDAFQSPADESGMQLVPGNMSVIIVYEIKMLTNQKPVRVRALRPQALQTL